ncbi:hypothetical protein KIPB_010514, partial [Kipferlia bialata]
GHGTRLTAFGTPCHDNMSQRFSLVEGIATNTLILVSIWGFVGLGRLILGIDWAEYMCYPIVIGVLLYMFAVSPALHGDTVGEWGYPIPFHPIRVLRGQEPYKGQGYRRERLSLSLMLAIMLGLVLCYTSIYIGSTLDTLGIRDNHPDLFSALCRSVTNRAGDSAYVPTFPLGYIVALVHAVLLMLLVVCLCVPAGNAAPSLKFASTTWAFVCVVTLLVIFGYNSSQGEKRWPDGVYVFDWSSKSIIGHLSMYVFWGMVQQSIFLSYNHLRLSQGLPNTKMGRASVCGLCGFFFGIYHIPCWPLVGITSVFGVLMAVFWAQHKSRSILVFGMMHGIIGTLFDELTDVRMGVGPWYYH